jgi:hypothetical protein
MSDGNKISPEQQAGIDRLVTHTAAHDDTYPGDPFASRDGRPRSAQFGIAPDQDLSTQAGRARFRPAANDPPRAVDPDRTESNLSDGMTRTEGADPRRFYMVVTLINGPFGTFTQYSGPVKGDDVNALIGQILQDRAMRPPGIVNIVTAWAQELP